MRGFTLTETLVVIAIVSTAGLALTTALVDFYRQNAYLFESTSALENSRRALSTSVENLREATYGEDGAYPLIAAATSSVTFHADIDADNSVERVRFFISNGTFYRTTTNPGGNPPSYTGQTAATSTVIAYVRNATSTPFFRYFDATGAELATPIDIGSVTQVLVRVDIDLNPNRAPEIFTLSGRATLRNVVHQ
ncbi:type II secretion system GspH family protein [Patescibacteria group bacterium]|nr:type II secretion system GspH family protein [Patescibacteria group bacterium]